MPHPTQNAQVILRHCDTYDADRIADLAFEGLTHLDLTPFGRTLLKPNVVAAGELFEDAYTRPELVEGVLRALQKRSTGRVEEFAVGERCGITVPTRVSFEQAGYNPMLERLGVERYCFEEETQVKIPLTHPERLRDYVYTPEPVARADFFVNCPKFKAHPWTTVTFSMKNYIGIQDDRHRLIDHDHRLDQKIADLQYIVQPQFICVDAIVAGEGRMLTPIPFPLHMVIMGNNQVSFDAVCCHIIGLDPLEVPHIRLAHERGFGPVDLDAIEISGDVSFEEARERAAGFRVGLIRVEKYFEGTNICAYAGPPPNDRPKDDLQYDYCWGGCPGALEEAIEILRRFDDQCEEKIPRTHIIFGAYDGPIDARPGERVVFIGDCASWKGELHGHQVDVKSEYRDRLETDPDDAKHQDVFVKLATVTRKLQASEDAAYVRFNGCPTSVAEQVLVLVTHGHLKNPILDPKYSIPFNAGYLGWRSATAVQRALGKKYQEPGEAVRGKAAPEVVPPD
jgi:uncharacterized protein (DUF362 family)